VRLLPWQPCVETSTRPGTRLEMRRRVQRGGRPDSRYNSEMLQCGGWPQQLQCYSATVPSATLLQCSSALLF